MNIDLDIKFRNYSNSGSLTNPVIFKDKSSLIFPTTIVGVNGASQTISVSGYNLTANIVITCSPGWIINTNNGNVDQSPITLNPTGTTVLATTIYCKFNPAAGASYTGSINMTSTGATSRTVAISGVGVVDVAPVYSPAEIFIGCSLSVLDRIGEIGQPYSAVFTSDFAQNDAGNISQLRIEKDGTDIDLIMGGNNLVTTDSGVFDVAAIVFRAFADYAAGPIKNYNPSGNVDARPPAIRNINNPQDSETNFASSIIQLRGELFIFYGPRATPPTTSVEVRSLPSKISSTEGKAGPFNLITGTAFPEFNISIPVGLTLVKVLDLTAGNVDVTANFINNPFTVDDLLGNPNNYDNYTWSAGSPFPFNHQLQIKIA